MYGLLAHSVSSPASTLAQVSPLAIWYAVWPYLVMLLGFSVIVFVHELGHFVMAKWADVKVERFAIGFGRELFGYTKGETRYSFNILPLGGYVKMLGQEDFDDKSQELQFSDDPRSFVNKPVSHRMAIVSAGVIMNIIFAALVFMVVFMIGMEARGTRIGFLEPDSPADRSGLRAGDNIVSINGEKVREWHDVSMAIQLAPPHEPIKFIVERDGKAQQPLFVKPDYRRPDNTRDARRQMIGIASGFTRNIIWVGPGIDRSRADRPHVGDVIVEIDGVKVTDENASAMRNVLAYAEEVYVERTDPANPDAPAKRVRVEIPPLLAIYPSDSTDRTTISVLGLTPLLRIAVCDPDGRAALAGLEVGDTILNWDDVHHPDMTTIDRAIRDLAETDIYFVVRKPDGRIESGFVRPESNRYGPATIQAVVDAIHQPGDADGGPRARFESVRPGGLAATAGIEAGDVILRCDGKEHPSAGTVRKAIRNGSGDLIALLVRKTDGQMMETAVRPQAPGAIDAEYPLVADDVMETGRVVPTINGEPSPAAEAGIPDGVRLTSLDGRPIPSWHEMIAMFGSHAGTTVDLGYVDKAGEEHTVPFRVPQSLRTLLGVGPAARIVSIDGKKTVETTTNRGVESVHVAYHEGTRALLTDLVGEKNVPVEFYPTPLGELETAYIDVTEDMVDPWMGRVAMAPNVEVSPETKLLKGENLLDAVMIGVHKTYYFILQVYVTIKRIIVSHSVGVENLSGPLGIVQVGGQIAQAGFVKFLYFIAIISANLAVINFLPLPIVDGGLMVFLIIEKIKGSPVSLRVQIATQMIGIFLIISAFLFVTYNDVLRMMG